MAPGKTPDAVEARLMKAVPARYRLHAHHWLILHGRYTCTARKPKCPVCAIRDLCGFKDKTTGVGDALAADDPTAQDR
jgi:endonuclease-3